MKGKRIISMLIISGLTSLLWLFGLGWTIQGYFQGSKVAEKPEVQIKTEVIKGQNGIDIVALGDSLTRGTGDEEGKGYVGHTIDMLKEKTDQKLLLRNLGIKGLTSNELLEQIQQQEVGRQIKQADHILISIGGNDLFQGGQALVELNEENVQKVQAHFSDNINTILSDVRKLNGKATIYMIGLYNPFIELDNGADTSKIVRDWNFQTAAIAAEYPNTVLVPTFDLFQLKVNDYLYSDKFHPNSKGYKLIAERVASLITW